MYKSLQIFYFTILLTQICFAQWYQQNRLPQGNSLHAVKFVTPSVGWCVGDGGTILKTTDGGNSWYRQEIERNNPLWGISFTDVNIGTIVGGGIILRTTNGGLNWDLQSTGGDFVSGFTGVSFSDANNGTVIGLYWAIFRTTNGGANWIQQSYSTLGGSYGVSFASENNGLIVGRSYDGTISHYGVARTTDGGANWAFVEIGTSYELYSVYLSDANNGTTVGDNGKIFRTTNGGLNWIPQTSGTSNMLKSVFFIDPENGYAVGANGTILRTNDGGTLWTTQYSNTTLDLNGVSFADVNNGIAVGDYGTILRTTNGGSNWMVVSNGPTNDWTDIFFADQNKGLVIGDAGTILRTTNGGTNWTRVITGTTNDFTSMCFIDGNKGWAVTGIIHGFHTELRDSSFIFQTTDGGATWIKQLTLPLTLLDDISFVDANNGWVVGTNTDSIWWISSYAILLQTDNGGMTWNHKNIDKAPDRIQFIDSNNGWMKWTVTGSGPGGPWGGLAKTTDGGTTWIQQLGDHFNDFQFRDVNNGIAVARRYINNFKSAYTMEDAQWGIISKTTDGGDTWSSDSIDSPAWDVHYINNNTVVTLGKRFDDQVICYWSTDAGSTWNPRTTGIYEDVHHIFFIDEQNGWMIGNNGAIYHTTNGGVVPVELNSFTASANGKEVTLSWSTATELNNQGFEVQRKFGSNDFVTVGSVKGHGTTTSPKNYTYIDKLLTSGKYFYRLKQIDFGGKYEYSQEVEVNRSPFTTYKLEQNYPNPFNPVTTIGFGVPEKGNVRLSILNILGEEIKVFLNEEKEAGYHSIDFNGSDLPSGVYFYQLRAGSFVETKKMILLR